MANYKTLGKHSSANECFLMILPRFIGEVSRITWRKLNNAFYNKIVIPAS